MQLLTLRLVITLITLTTPPLVALHILAIPTVALITLIRPCRATLATLLALQVDWVALSLTGRHQKALETLFSNQRAVRLALARTSFPSIRAIRAVRVCMMSLITALIFISSPC